VIHCVFLHTRFTGEREEEEEEEKNKNLTANVNAWPSTAVVRIFACYFCPEILSIFVIK